MRTYMIKANKQKHEVAHKINQLNYVTTLSDILFITFSCYPQPSCHERSHTACFIEKNVPYIEGVS